MGLFEDDSLVRKQPKSKAKAKTVVEKKLEQQVQQPKTRTAASVGGIEDMIAFTKSVSRELKVVDLPSADQVDVSKGVITPAINYLGD